MDTNQVKEFIINKLGGEYDTETLYFITVQGPTGSGKTTFTSLIANVLRKFGLLPLLIHIDSFYDFVDNSRRDATNFDYDNPKTINWNAIDEAILSIINREDKITLYQRSQSTANEPYVQHNLGYNIILLEGIYALNCISKKKFNLDEFDPHDSLKKYKNEYIDNPIYSLIKKISISEENGKKWKSIKHLNIRFLLCKDRLKYIRLARDKINRKLEADELLPRLDKFIYRATTRWVYSKEFESDIDVQHGNYNTEAIELLKGSIFEFFGLQDVKEKFQFDMDLSDSKNNSCTQFCEPINNGSIYLEDNNCKAPRKQGNETCEGCLAIGNLKITNKFI